MSNKITELEEKHWEECRQIALYDDQLREADRLISEYDAELKEVKRRVGQLYTENIRLQTKILGEDTQEEEEEE